MSLAEDALVESLCGSYQSKDSGDKVTKNTWWEWHKELKTVNHRLAKRIAGLKNVDEADAFYLRYRRGEERPKKSADEKRLEEYQLAQSLMENFNFLTTTDNEQLWVYEDGVWGAEGEVLVKASVEDVFQDEATVHRTIEVIGHIKRDTLKGRDLFNSRDDLLNVENGTVDMGHNPPEILQHDPDHYFTHKLPVAYDSDADCPKIQKFFADVLKPEDVERMEEWIGYYLRDGYPYHNLEFWHGGGRNGKTTMKTLHEAFLGEDNVSNISIQQLNEDRFGPAELYGKLANLCGDLPERPLKYTGIIKNLTGSDRLMAQQKHRDPFHFANRAKLVFSGNELPEVSDRTLAWWERIIVVPFPNKFLAGDPRTDPDIIEKLTTEKELSGLLNLALAGLQRLLTRKGFSRSTTSHDVKRSYLRISSPVLAFLLDCLQADEDSEIEKEAVYQSYCFYCKQNGIRAEATGPFTSKMKQYANEIKAYVEVKRASHGNRPYVWRGISWTDNPLKDRGNQQKVD